MDGFYTDYMSPSFEANLHEGLSGGSLRILMPPSNN